ncbi:hypothetical protein PROFUN_15246 [Planoprotostelium fungivorum]|uniref:Uncharacterized protein n=1 Tax=Planoprotostelium fungivorum TaxID=1890364 RepID=A0A2P6MXD7_9EUKA|nr:hypothetical protein PROFUN_15246 [Planoprotostelium fungivorum]
MEKRNLLLNRPSTLLACNHVQSGYTTVPQYRGSDNRGFTARLCPLFGRSAYSASSADFASIDGLKMLFITSQPR